VVVDEVVGGARVTGTWLPGAWVILVLSVAWVRRPLRHREHRAQGRPIRWAGVMVRRHGHATLRRRPGRAEGRLLTELATTAELLAVAVSGGLALGAAIEAVHRHLPADHRELLAGVVSDLARGVRLDVAMQRWAADAPAPVASLAALVRSADRSGAAIAPAFERFARDARRQRRRAAEERARRLPVQMLVPLVVCVLPAFGLIALVPMVAVGLDDLTSPVIPHTSTRSSP
jgi:Flp pilus assembly protein TadB